MHKYGLAYFLVPSVDAAFREPADYVARSLQPIMRGGSGFLAICFLFMKDSSKNGLEYN
jgi:hypothetical protein